MNFTKPTASRVGACLAAALLLAGCAPAAPRAGTPPPSPAPASDVYFEEFEPAVARTATEDERLYLSQSVVYRDTAATLSEDKQTFQVLRTDNGADECSQAPSRLMVLDERTILITYDYLGDPEQPCTLTGVTRVDEFTVPPGVDAEGMEVRLTNENSHEPNLELTAPPTTVIPLPSITSLDGTVSPIASPAQSALIQGTDITQRRPVLVPNDDETFTVVRPDGAEPCSYVASELIALSASEISINYRYLAKDGDGASCSVEQIDRVDLLEIPAGVSGEIAVSFTYEIAMFGPILIESSAP